MSTFITLVNFTDEGIRNINDTPQRAQAFRDAAEKVGATVKDVYWTLGSYDIVAILEAPDAATVQSLLLGIGSLGNVRTQTLQGFSADEMNGIIANIP